MRGQSKPPLIFIVGIGLVVVVGLLGYRWLESNSRDQQQGNEKAAREKEAREREASHKLSLLRRPTGVEAQAEQEKYFNKLRELATQFGDTKAGKLAQEEVAGREAKAGELLEKVKQAAGDESDTGREPYYRGLLELRTRFGDTKAGVFARTERERRGSEILDNLKAAHQANADDGGDKYFTGLRELRRSFADTKAGEWAGAERERKAQEILGKLQRTRAEITAQFFGVPKEVFDVAWKKYQDGLRELYSVPGNDKAGKFAQNHRLWKEGELFSQFFDKLSAWANENYFAPLKKTEVELAVKRAAYEKQLRDLQTRFDDTAAGRSAAEELADLGRFREMELRVRFDRLAKQIRHYQFSPPLSNQVDLYLRFIEGGWAEGRRPSFQLLEAIEKSLVAIEGVRQASRFVKGDARLRLEKRVAELKQAALERGPNNIADALVRDRNLNAKDIAALDVLLADAEATSQLSLNAGAFVRFRDLQKKRAGGLKPSEKALQLERAMAHWGKTSDAERVALKELKEQEKFLDNPEEWMDQFLAKQADKESILQSRKMNAARHRQLYEKCPRCFPMGSPGVQ